MAQARESCYACQEPGTTTEHVPPLCVFPEEKDTADGANLRQALITVPACPTHNTKKSGEDVYLWHVLTLNRDGNSVAVQQAMTKFARATARKPGLFLAMTEQTVEVEKHARTGEVIDATELSLDGDRFERGMQLMARALHRAHFGTRWLDTVGIVPEFIVAKSSHADDAAFADVSRIADKLFSGVPMLGANPSVFAYQVVDAPARLRVARLTFFEGTRVLAYYGIPLGSLIESRQRPA